MQKVKIEIKNDAKASKNNSVVEPIYLMEEAPDYMRAVGKALSIAADALTKQHDAPIILIDGISLTDAQIKVLKMKKRDFFKYHENFNVVQNTIAGILMSASIELQAEYIRKTDVNDYYKNTKVFTEQQFHSQVVAFSRATKFAVKFAKEDAAKSTMPEAIERRLAIQQEVSRVKRLAAKQEQLVLVSSN